MQKITKTDLPRPSSMHVTSAMTPSATPSSHLSRSKRETASPTAVDNIDDRVKRTPKPRRFHGSPPPPGDAGSFEDNDDVTLRHTSNRQSSNDDGMEKFFSGVTTKRDENLDCSVGDFDLLEVEPQAPLVHHKKDGPRLPNRRQRGSKNPIKHLSTR